MELLTSVNPGLFVWAAIIFLLLVLVLSKLAWKPIIASLKEREASIQDALNTAAIAREEISKLKSDNEKLLREAREEREKMLREARDISNRIKDEAQTDAKKTADKIIEDAKAAIQIEKQAAMREVREQVALFSLEIAEKILRKNLSGDKEQKTLVETYINDLKLTQIEQHV